MISSSYSRLSAPTKCNSAPWIVGALVAAVIGGIVLVVVLGFKNPPAPVITALALQGTFTPYPNRTVPIDVRAAMVEFQFVNTSVIISYSGLTADPGCLDGVLPDTANSCGIHIHAGTTCADMTKVGGHHYNIQAMTSDPWLRAYYTRIDGSLIVNHGFTYKESVGHAFVIHDKHGIRLSCELLLPQDYRKVYTGTPYVGYEGPLTAVGQVELNFQNTAVSLNYNFSNNGTLGGDPNCWLMAPNGKPNSCGIHIHVGNACDPNSTVGGHFYNSATLSADPWTYLAMYSNYTGFLRFFEFGHTFAEAAGRTLVIHDYNGVRITCDLLVEPRSVPFSGQFMSYPGYTPGIIVRGDIRLTFQMFDVMVWWNLTSFNDSCVENGPSATLNSCGIHIHVGRTCTDNALVGGHFWNGLTGVGTGVDPWKYVAVGPGTLGQARVLHNASWTDSAGRVLVVHNYAGVRISCTELPSV